VVLEEGFESEAFWGKLGGQGPVKSAAEAGADEEADTKAAAEIILYNVVLAGEEPQFQACSKVSFPGGCAAVVGIICWACRPQFYGGSHARFVKASVMP